MAKFCDFHDADFEIKMQIVLHGTSSRLRKRALRDPDYTSADMLIDGRKTETIHVQCSGMESQFQAVQVNNITKKSDSTCYNCGFSYPHKDQLCPACNAIRAIFVAKMDTRPKSADPRLTAINQGR